mgnify:CR=1 FL=1|jgi:hypothetical protein
MQSDHIMDLVEACNSLVAAGAALEASLRKHARWVWLPPCEHLTTPEKEVDAAIQKLCFLYRKRDDDINLYPESGLISVSEEVIAPVEAFNAAKQRFKDVIGMIKGGLAVRERNKSIASLLLDEDSKRQASAATRKSLSKVKFAELNLIDAYKAVRFLPHKDEVRDASLLSASWSWQRRRREIIRMTTSELQKYARAKIADAGQLDHVMRQIAELDSRYWVARVRTQELPQLKVNYAYQGVNGRTSGMASAANVFLTLSRTRPDLRYPPKDLPDTPRLQRSDTLIHAEPYIPSLGVHRYIKPVKVPDDYKKGEGK